MSTHKSSAIWKGNLAKGKGTMNVGEGAWQGNFSAKSRFEGSKDGTSPEELIAAAHAGCFSMAFSHALSESGHEPKVWKQKQKPPSKKEQTVSVSQKFILPQKGKFPE
ncbi:OsmC family peroxiredoxin [Marinilabilia salmonicolor]|uniref:OsmC family peroxiredoxin n=1 Tax=Marinilabilia salmonicolor TaxID=989 RepID=UPI001F292C26|nr:OsmC family peroxiredoxin [Marinilabilia salmonicolor]